MSGKVSSGIFFCEGTRESTVYVVVDGLDDMEEDERDEFLDSLRHLAT